MINKYQPTVLSEQLPIEQYSFLHYPDLSMLLLSEGTVNQKEVFFSDGTAANQEQVLDTKLVEQEDVSVVIETEEDVKEVVPVDYNEDVPNVNEESVLNTEGSNEDVPDVNASQSKVETVDIDVDWIRSWVPHFGQTVDLPEEKKDQRDTIENFWFDYFAFIFLHYQKYNINKNEDSSSYDDFTSLYDPDTRTIRIKKSDFVNIYRREVYELLKKNQNKKDPVFLKKLQKQIEEMTSGFNEANTFSNAPTLMRMLTRNTCLPTAKEFLRGKYKLDQIGGRIQIFDGKEELPKAEQKRLKPILDSSDFNLLNEFGEHTLECLLVHTLSYIFNIANDVSLAGLIDRLESCVRQYAESMQRIKRTYVQKRPEEVLSATKGRKLHYPFGTALVEFLISLKLVGIHQLYTDEIASQESKDNEDVVPPKFVKRVSKRGQSFYRDKMNYAFCTFSTALLPIKLSLPMITTPTDWNYNSNEIDPSSQWLTISDLYGGYLCQPTGEIYSSHRMMSSHDLKCFFIFFGENNKEESYQRADDLCKSISSLQRQAFQINSDLLNQINKNRALFESNGLLMPDFLSHLKINEACNLLRRVYNMKEYSKMKSLYKYSELVSILSKSIQLSRFQATILELANAYEGYSFYYPAFLDFRGRVYRSGIFHFHEGDFPRSLLLIDDKNNTTPIDEPENKLLIKYRIATAFHAKSFSDENQANVYLNEFSETLFEMLPHVNSKEFSHSEWKDIFFKNIMELSVLNKAKRPFQFLSNVYHLMLHGMKEKTTEKLSKTVPVTQDASASAYQIMSYFLLDETMAIRTNLFESEGINDIYSFFREELITFLKINLENKELCSILDRIITRKIVKSIFMPIIYGKTINSTIKDLSISLRADVLPLECVKLATQCFAFWKQKYSGMDSFIELISLVGRVCSSLERPVLYSTNYSITSQDYKIMESCNVKVYSAAKKKHCSVTMRFPSDVRDKRKSRASTFVNFIHQKDAQIAMFVANALYKVDVPLYTVHDNFISNTHYSWYMPDLYLAAFKNLGPPLTIINKFLFMNLIEPNLGLNEKKLDIHTFHSKVIPIAILNRFLSEDQIPPSEMKNKKGWIKIIRQLKESYFLYCRAVCGREVKYSKHEEKWIKFRSKLKGKFCVHH